MIKIFKTIEENISVPTETSDTTSKCPVAKKVDLNSLSSCSEPLENRVSNLNMSSDKITTGQGEYIVFQNEKNKELSRELFEQVYEILIQYSPTAIINSGSDKIVEVCANRYELIQSKVQEIDPNLEVVFVPRTLYELFFIRKCIREDIKNQKICPFVTPYNHKIFSGDFYNKFREEPLQKILKEDRAMRKCWHLCFFDDAGDNEHAGVKDIAYRLNQAIVKTLSPSKEGFTYQEISAHTDKEIEFLKTFYKEKEAKSLIDSYRDSDSYSRGYPGPTIAFGRELHQNYNKPMVIRNGTDAQIIRNAIKLDCSDIAQKSFFLYRGGDFQEDSISHYDKEIPYSLSYGTSLFAGCIYDADATAFYYIRKQKNGYAIPIPFAQLNTSPFYIPPTHTIAQLSGKGEIFHGRTKIWKGFEDLQDLGGIQGILYTRQKPLLMNCLKTNLSKEALITLFQKYKSTAIQLKTA